MSALLSLHQAGYRYPCGVRALTDLSWEIPAGRRVAILGGNGAGKTTLLHCLQGLLPLTEGELALDGVSIGRDRAARRALRAAVGLVFQHADDQLFAGDVAADVAYGPLNLGWAHATVRGAVDGVLRDLGIETLQDRPLHALSHGQRKLAAMAGVLVMRPRVVLLDEPTAGLDHAGQVALRALLDRLQAGGLALVISTHDLDFAAARADEVLLLQAGRLLARGTPETVLTQEDLLRQAGLELPWVYALARHLWPMDGAWPRTRMQILERLSAQKGWSDASVRV